MTVGGDGYRRGIWLSARVGTLETEPGSVALLPESIASVWHLRLTGTGSGELWGLWVDGEPWEEVSQSHRPTPSSGKIDKHTGAIISQMELTELEDTWLLVVERLVQRRRLGVLGRVVLPLHEAR